jgi:2-C-methyl-D-erythritol 4-phosphate cytidylyltransferase
MRYWLVMPAAGGGQRFGGPVPKQYLPLAGRTLIEHALAPFLADARCEGVCVALAPADELFATLPLADERIGTVIGGSERAASVLAALDAIPATDTDWVMVHDAARPCVSREEIDRLILAAMAGGGALLAAPVADTLKSGEGNHVASTLPREGVWRALTPQVFRAGALRAALRKAQSEGRVPTDESQALEWQGESPAFARGSALNVKVTEPGDLQLAEAILSLRGSAK